VAQTSISYQLGGVVASGGRIANMKVSAIKNPFGCCFLLDMRALIATQWLQRTTEVDDAEKH
jgi:hypothetical protein